MWTTAADITRLGEPALFWGVTGGCIDSLVANRTASGKRRREDDFTAGGINNRRPDRAVIVYANLIRRWFKETKPIVLGGIEASLRRIAHYDAWSNRVRRSILIDAKADLLVYGMGEKTVLELAARLKEGRAVSDLRGLCYVAAEKDPGMLELPSYEEAAADPAAFTEMFLGFYRNQDPRTAQALCQRQDSRWLIHNPPMPPLTEAEMDEVHGMDFDRDVHPLDRRNGKVRALETIRFSIPTHRGCYGECHFCAIAVHEGRTVSSRSEASILREAERLASLPDFKGYILDVGGPTANMYGFECRKKLLLGACPEKRCLYPAVCDSLRPDHSRQISLLRKLRRIPGVKQAIVASGIRYDLVLADRKQGIPYLREVVRHHVSGQMKIAPEHSEERVLECMGKPGRAGLIAFRDLFRRLTAEAGKEQFLTYYLIAAHPGCTAGGHGGRCVVSHPGNSPSVPNRSSSSPRPPPRSQRSCITQSETPSAEERSLSRKRPPDGSARKRFWLRKKAFSGMEIPGLNQTTKEEESWVRTRTSKKKPRRNLPKR